MKTPSIAAAAALALAASSVGLGAPAGPPNRGADPADFPPAVWAQTASRQIWLEAPRTGFTPSCTDPRCDYLLPPKGLTEATALVPNRDVRAEITVRVGEIVRFHLPAPSGTRPMLRVGQLFNVRTRVGAGRVFGLGSTDAPWWRVTRKARSGMATLTTSTGTYWFKLAVRS